MDEMYEPSGGRTTNISFKFCKASGVFVVVLQFFYMESCVLLELSSFMDKCLIIVLCWGNSGLDLLLCYLGAITLLIFSFCISCIMGQGSNMSIKMAKVHKASQNEM